MSKWYYYDELHDTLLEYAYVELFACFEATVIEHINLASGEMERIIKSNYSSPFPFVSYEDKFVKKKDDIGSLNKIVDLLSGKIPEALFSDLKEFVKYRDKLAHGKRFHEDLVLKSIEETYKIMVQILEEIAE